MSGRSDLLRSVPLLSGLTAAELDRLAERTREVEVPDGGTVLRQGEPGDEFFLVIDGTLVIDRDGQGLARLGPGEFLGEISLLDGRPRSATATADGPVRLLVLGRSALRRGAG